MVIIVFFFIFVIFNSVVGGIVIKILGGTVGSSLFIGGISILKIV